MLLIGVIYEISPNHVTPEVRPIFSKDFLFGKDVIQHGQSSSKGVHHSVEADPWPWDQFQMCIKKVSI